MTVLRPGEHADELISASLTGELTEIERAALDQHLAACPRCRETLAAFRQERQLISGMRHLQPPADLGARVRVGIEAGDLPWWQRRSTLVGVVGSLGAVAAGLLAVVILNNVRPGPVAQQTASPSASIETSVSAEPSAPVSIAATPSAPASSTPVPQPTVNPNPVGTMRYTLDRQRPKLEVVTTKQQTATELDISQYGMPIDAALSPDGSWLAFRIMGDATGLVDTYAYRNADGILMQLAQQSLDSPFSRLAWSADSQLLAYTVGQGDTESSSTWDAWVFYAQADAPTTRQLTTNGASFAADFPLPATDGVDMLWVSVAGENPVTYGVALDGTPLPGPIDPVAIVLPGQTHEGAFLPVRAPGDRSPAAVWHGRMQDGALGWTFTRGGMLYLAQPRQDGTFADLGTADQQIFDTLAIPPGGEAFGSARFVWAPDGDGLAVWDAQWVGAPQEPGFPDETRVYFGHPTTGTMIGSQQALDQTDTAGRDVVHVSLAGGPYLAITVLTQEGSEGGTFGPTAELRLVTRNLGDVKDEVQTFGADKVWNGPAFYPAAVNGEGQ
ncbi:MAG TPA: zf-HC2 domain-containing protein [Candidatus Limnocylindria bacterium]